MGCVFNGLSETISSSEIMSRSAAELMSMSKSIRNSVLGLEEVEEDESSGALAGLRPHQEASDLSPCKFTSERHFMPEFLSLVNF